MFDLIGRGESSKEMKMFDWSIFALFGFGQFGRYLMTKMCVCDYLSQ